MTERCLLPSQLPSGVASLSSFYVKVGSVLHKSIIFHLFSDTSTCIWKGTCSLYDISIKRRINYPLGLNWGLGCGPVLMHLCAKRHFYFKLENFAKYSFEKAAEAFYIFFIFFCKLPTQFLLNNMNNINDVNISIFTCVNTQFSCKCLLWHAFLSKNRLCELWYALLLTTLQYQD